MIYFHKIWIEVKIPIRRHNSNKADHLKQPEKTLSESEIKLESYKLNNPIATETVFQHIHQHPPYSDRYLV